MNVSELAELLERPVQHEFFHGFNLDDIKYKANKIANTKHTSLLQLLPFKNVLASYDITKMVRCALKLPDNYNPPRHGREWNPHVPLSLTPWKTETPGDGTWNNWFFHLSGNLKYVIERQSHPHARAFQRDTMVTCPALRLCFGNRDFSPRCDHRLDWATWHTHSTMQEGRRFYCAEHEEHVFTWPMPDEAWHIARRWHERKIYEAINDEHDKVYEVINKERARCRAAMKKLVIENNIRTLEDAADTEEMRITRGMMKKARTCCL